jgi:DNA polymerase phi
LLQKELQSCSDLVFGDKPIVAGSSKKRKADDEEDDEEEPHPIDVIVDILLSFLAKPSILLRGITEHVFKVFSSQLTPNALDLIFEVNIQYIFLSGFNA